ncbi:MAG: nitroreductase family deazaflavin-dependent oxidoreductase [Alphaproteobacteria bacterium]
MSARLAPFRRLLLRAPASLYRRGWGCLLGRRFLLLIHAGRRTGLRRETVLEIVEYREQGPEAVVVSGFGRDADWLRNIEARPDAEEVMIGRSRFAASHRVLAADEAVRVVAGYERRNRFVAPVVRFVLSRLLGWPYHGTESERRLLAAQLPLVAFRPRT